MKPAKNGWIDPLLYLGSAILTAIGLTQIKLLAGGVMDAPEDVWGLVHLALYAIVYFAGLGLWLAAMARNPLSVAYPIGIGLSLASATLAAGWWLGEDIHPGKILGILLILAGATALSRSRTH